MRLIDEIWAIVGENPDDDPPTEGVVAFQTRDGWLPLIAADPARLKHIREMGKVLSAAQGKAFKVIKFSTREVVETLDGRQ